MRDGRRDLYFIPSDGDPRIIAKGVDCHIAIKTIREFLDYHGYKSYYTRSWETSEGTVYDFGSWSEFFLWGAPNGDAEATEEGEE